MTKSKMYLYLGCAFCTLSAIGLVRAVWYFEGLQLDISMTQAFVMLAIGELQLMRSVQLEEDENTISLTLKGPGTLVAKVTEQLKEGGAV
jgi:predicted nuclease of restriction endonuclease-like RecB superfamily